MSSLANPIHRVTEAKPRKRRLELMAVITSATLAVLTLAVLAIWKPLPATTQRTGANQVSGQASLANTDSQGRLVIVSRALPALTNADRDEGLVTVVDRANGRELYAIPTTADVEAVLSPDGSLLYVATAATQQSHGLDDRLMAIDSETGKELWRVQLRDRVRYILGNGPSTLTVSPDGRWLYVFSYPVGRLEQYPAAQVPMWLQIIDAATGQALPDNIALPECSSAQVTASQDNKALYVACGDSNDVRFVNLETRQVEYRLRVPGSPGYLRGGQPGAIADAMLAPDGYHLYVITDNAKVVVIDTLLRTVTREVGFGQASERIVPYGLAALSADGQRLILGFDTSHHDPGAEELRYIDTASWLEVDRFTTPMKLSGQSLVVGQDGHIYSIAQSSTERVAGGAPRLGGDAVLVVATSSERVIGATPLVIRPNELVLRVLVSP